MEDELERTLRDIEFQRHQQKERDKALALSWVLLGAGLLLLGTCAALIFWLLPRLGGNARSPAALGMIGGLCVGLIAGAVAVIFFVGRIWRIFLGVPRQRKKEG